MATGVGFSFDTSFLKNLEKADAKMASLMDKSNQASRSIVSAFQQINNQGVVPFVQSLEKQKQTLDSVFDAITTKTGKARKGYEGMASSVIDATNALVSLISKMKSTSQYQLDTKLTGLSSQIKELQEYQERQRQVKVASSQAMNAELDKYRQLIERVRELNSIKAQAKEVKTTSTDKELVKDANKAQREANAELRILKEQQKQIEQKYAVETALIRKQADAQSFQDKVRQAKEAEKAVEAEIKREQDAYLKSLSEKIRAQQEYSQRMKELEQARLRQQSANRRASYKLDLVGGTGMNAADNALRYTERIYSDRGLLSVNNMQKAILQMQQAQNRLNLNTEEGKKKYEQLSQRIKTIQNDINKATGASEEFNKKQKGILDTSGQLARAFAAVFSVSAIKGYVNKLMQIRGEFELQQRSLQVLLQNKDEANALWDKTVALAVKSPYTTKQLVTATKQLAAYRVESEKLYETNKMLADISIGLGVDMNRLILAFGQVKAANFLRGTELRQFSEAGVNMLDELAKRFTMLEGRAVSVGEVFDRVSKRMVSFKDVEAVFKTITSEGGTFYQMQEKQSETLKGMMLNLKDSYELALNDMGKSNEGMLKGFVSMMKTLVDNWKTLSEILKAAVPLFGALRVGGMLKSDKIKEMAIDFGVLTSNIPKQLKPLQLLELGWKKVATAVKSFTKSLALNPWLLAITALAYGVTKLVGAWRDHQKQLEEVTKKYQELRDEVADISVGFIYADNRKELEEEFNKLSEIAKQHSIEFPVNLKQMSDEEIKRQFNDIQNQVLDNIAFAEKFEKAFINSDGIVTWGNGIEKDFEQLSISANQLSTELRTSVRDLVVYLETTGQLTQEMKEALSARREGETEYDYIKRVSNAYYEYLKVIKATTEQINKGGSSAIQAKYRQLSEMWGEDLYGRIMKTRNAIEDFYDKEEEALKEFDQFAAKLSTEISPLWNDETRAEKIKFAIDKKGLDDITKAIWYRLSEEKFGITIKPEVPKKKEITGWMKEYNEFVGTLQQAVDKEGNTLTIVKPMQADTDPTEYLNKLKGTYERLQKDIEAWDAGNAKARAQYDKDEIKAIKAQNAERKKAIDWLEYDKKKNKKEESEELKRLKEQIRLVRQLADDYEEMWKKYGKAYADANIKSEARRNAFAELELNIDDFEVGTRENEKINLGKLLEKALGIEGGKVEVEKAIADVEVELKWDIQQKNDDAIKRELESLFGSYEIYMELDKLNIPKDVMKNLFGVEPIELPEVRVKGLEKVGLGSMANLTDEAILASQAYKDLNEEQQKDLAQHLKNVADMERKAQVDRLKKYVAFARGAISERAKVKLEEMNTIAEIEKTFEHKETDTEEQKTAKTKYKGLAMEQARKEANDALQKLDWEAFKSSDTFNTIFDDLENAGEKSLQSVIDKLKDFKKQWKDMPFDQMRQVVDLLQKAEEAQKVESNPFKEGKRLQKAIKEDGRSKEQALLDLSMYENLIKISEDDLSRYETYAQIQDGILSATTLTADEQKEYEEWSAKSVDAQRMLVESAKLQRQESEKGVGNAKKQLTNIDKLTDAYKEQETALNEINKLSQDLYKSFRDLAENGAALFGEELDETTMIFADMGASMADTVMQTVALWINLKSVETGAYAAGTALNSAMGVIGWIVMAVQLLSQALKAVVQAYDNKRQKQIEAEAKNVERLQKAYENLKETIDTTYDLSTLQQTAAIANKNIEEQIAAQERMIALEEEKKKTDQSAIDGYNKEIEDLKKQQKELKEQVLEEKGGFGSDENRKSAAEAFVDAWLQAYKETGDGLSGLNDQFNEFYESFVKKQLLLQGSSKYLEAFFNQFDERIASITQSGATKEQIEHVANEIKSIWDGTSSNLDAFLSSLAEALKVSEMLGTTELAGLQAGISGITEDQADVLAAYMNSIRFFVADSNMQLKSLVAAQGIDTDVPNPMLAQLMNIAESVRQNAATTDAINDLLNRVKLSTNDGTALKVRMV